MTNQQKPKPIPVAHSYRNMLATAAVIGGPISPLRWMVCSTSDQPYSPEQDTAPLGEFARVEVSATVSGPTATVVAVLPGADAGDNIMRSVAILTESGVLVAREVFKPKEFELDTEFELILDLEY